PPNDIFSRIYYWRRRQIITRDAAPFRASGPPGYDLFSDDRTPYGSRFLDRLPSCDIVNLHWVARFVDFTSFFSHVPVRTPVVWTLHDMNPFTGGCHYSY